MPPLLWCYYSATLSKGNELLLCITHQSRSTGLRVEPESTLLFTAVSREGNSFSLKLNSIEAHPTMLCHSLTLVTSSSVDTWVIPPLSWTSNPIQLFSSTIILFLNDLIIQDKTFFFGHTESRRMWAFYFRYSE